MIFVVSYVLFLFPLLAAPPLTTAAGGRWELLQKSIGVSAMHAQLLHNDRVVVFDRTDFGRSNLSLPNGICRRDPNDTALKVDCTAHSAEYDVASNTFRPLMVQTDVWCSSGAVIPNGSLIQTGGYQDGDHVVRAFNPCFDCDWEEVKLGLTNRRWYATNHILPDGRQIIIGGRRQFNYEFYPKNEDAREAYSLPFLVQTNDPYIENNLYPFVFLNVDGNLFVFANNRSVLLDYSKNKIVKIFPEIPDGDPRNYPSSGSAVLLPLKNLKSQEIEAEVMVCGGAPKGSYFQAVKGNFVGALNSCGRIKITDPNPKWVMEIMPIPRVMGDMVLLPNGNVLIINGGSAGTAGWEFCPDPVLTPVIYRPDNPSSSRFELQNPATIPRLYHSVALLLRDGRIFIGGSNPHTYYNFTGVRFPTDLSLEAFSPYYLDPEFQTLRPTILSLDSHANLSYSQTLKVQFSIAGSLSENMVSVSMVAPPFNTHSFSMNHRMLVIGCENVTNVGQSTYEVEVTTPGSGTLAPSGYYLLFVNHQEIPSEGIWVKLE